MPGPSRAVFLSYASQDAEAARRICEALRASGIEVWFDQSELRGGDAWDRQIRKQIHDCLLFIPIISAHSQARLEGYFRREWKLAVDRTHDMAEEKPFLVPIVIDDTSEQAASVPDKFREVQWSRLQAGEITPAFVDGVSRLLSRDSSGPTPLFAEVRSSIAAMSKGPERGTRRRFSVSLLPLAITAGAFIAVAYIAVDKLWLPRRMAASSRANTAQVPVTEKSIAVLPFVDLSEKKDQEYFADGMAAEVTGLLATIPSLRVIGRTSSYQFKGRNEDLRTIGSILGAAYLVEGTVRKSGDHLRVTAELIDARDGTQRWSSTYNRSASDALEVQDAIATNLARTLQLTVSSDFGLRSSAGSAEAYDVYLRGLNALAQLSEDSTQHAAADFQRALDLDPAFAPAALGLARANMFRGEVAWLLPTRVAFEGARQAANLALKLDPKLGDAHAVRAEILTVYDWDWAGADLEIKQALQLGNRVGAMQPAAMLAAVRGEWDQATQFFETGLAADPLNANLHQLLGWGMYLRSGQFAKAETSMRRALEISPSIGSGRWFLGLSLLFQGRLDESLAVMQQETSYDGQLEGTAIVYYAMGKRTESDEALRRAIKQNAEEWPSAIARVYAFRKESNQAMKWLERAYAVRDEDLYFIKYDPLMKSLEGDPRYKAFLRKMNLPE
jgi:TolB-like protein/Tfp pilus assembly protein PilF